MSNFSQFFSDESDLYKELTTRATNPLVDGDLLQIDSSTGRIIGYDLISGVGTTEVLSETEVTSTLTFSTWVQATQGSTDSSTLTYTSTGVDLTGVFAPNDLVYFQGNFTGTLATTYGTSATGFLFAFPIRSITAPATDPGTNAWTIVLDLNRAPFKAWTDAATVELVEAETGTTITESGATQAFFTAAVAATTGLDVSLRTTTTVSEIIIDEYADGDLEIAGINADGAVIPLTSGDFGTPGQAVLVDADGTGLTFGAALTNNTATNAVPYWDGDSLESSPVTIGSFGEGGVSVDIDSTGEGATPYQLNVGGTTIDGGNGAVSGTSLSTQQASVDITTLAGSTPSALIYRAGEIRPIDLGSNGQVLAVDTSINPTSLRWVDNGITGVTSTPQPFNGTGYTLISTATTSPGDIVFFNYGDGSDAATISARVYGDNSMDLFGTGSTDVGVIEIDFNTEAERDNFASTVGFTGTGAITGGGGQITLTQGDAFLTFIPNHVLVANLSSSSDLSIQLGGDSFGGGTPPTYVSGSGTFNTTDGITVSIGTAEVTVDANLTVTGTINNLSANTFPVGDANGVLVDSSITSTEVTETTTKNIPSTATYGGGTGGDAAPFVITYSGWDPSSSDFAIGDYVEFGFFRFTIGAFTSTTISFDVTWIMDVYPGQTVGDPYDLSAIPAGPDRTSAEEQYNSSETFIQSEFDNVGGSVSVQEIVDEVTVDGNLVVTGNTVLDGINTFNMEHFDTNGDQTADMTYKFVVYDTMDGVPMTRDANTIYLVTEA